MKLRTFIILASAAWVGCSGVVISPSEPFDDGGVHADNASRDAGAPHSSGAKKDASTPPSGGNKADASTGTSITPSTAADAGTGTVTPPATGTGPSDAGTGLPMGGPGGYTKLIINDVFGSARPGANITSVSQFNPKTPYGAQGTGWDTWQKNWSPANTHAVVTMKESSLEIDPTNKTGAPGFIVSHFEAMPTATTSYYIEVEATTGRGGFKNGATWPAIWLYAGNESNANDQQAEIDIMESYVDQQWGSTADPTGLFTRYFATTIHGSPNHRTTAGPFATMTHAVDVTTTRNVYGCELTMVNGQVHWKVYFNGSMAVAASSGINWTSSAPAILVGWNPGSSPYSPAVFVLDSVRVWSK